MQSNQEEIFLNSSKRVVDSVLKGYNGTIFAYGQTGTGKTYTMVGDFENEIYKGIIPRSIDYIFSQIKKDKEHKYNISVSFIQIYLESIQDLLEPKNKEIRIREDSERGVYLDGVRKDKVNSTEDCKNLFHLGEKNRVTESTKMNSHSSRSHAILIVEIEKNIILSKEKIEELKKETNEQIKSQRVMTKSTLFLVDLAGSERVKKTNAQNMRLEEAKKINYSLLILGNCIQSLTESKPTYVSYRDSKLTRLLQESLGGNAKTSLIVTLSPSSYNKDETYSSLNFASRAMKVQNKPIINKSVDYQALCIKLQEDYDKLTDDYTNLKIEYDKVCIELKKYQNGEVFVELQRNSIANQIDSDINFNINNNNTNNNNKFELANEAKKRKDSNIDKETFQKEIKKLEAFYNNLINKKTEEYESILKDVDKILLQKESDVDKLTKENITFKEKIKNLSEIINDNKKEKEDLQNSITDLTNKLYYEKEVNQSKNEQTYKKVIDELNTHIEFLEKQIIPLENMNHLNKDSIDDFKNKIDSKINELKDIKKKLNKDLSNLIVGVSKNEIKIKINIDENDKNNNNLLTCKDENMKKIYTEKKKKIESEINEIKEKNLNIIKNQENLKIKINSIENGIQLFKKLKENFINMNNKDLEKYNKTELLCLKLFNEINDNLIEKNNKNLENNIKNLENDNSNLLNKIKNLEKTNSILINKISENSKENENLKNEFNSFKENNKKNNEINNKKNSDLIEKLNNNIKIEQNKNKNYEEKINILENNIKNLENKTKKKLILITIKIMNLKIFY